ncbi:hypothetical protein GWC77_13390 [Paraburkholderia sp. NMBU_R16]|uniref:hypothetical protein n=1 Tax=Paraburkholderia sp. NMBU_R16 TaxID=2698676 RepID=UPI001565B6C2|nr:hypothetical protein [Paraburkholderia sp. NMBU_R16]NRO96914.1 hypothetical protein [Paraburkholderia sp. NMBU_R16]
MDRRSFIVDSAALIAGVCGGSPESLASAPRAAASRTVAPATTVLVDASLGRSIAFAADAVSTGASTASVAPVEGDIGALWYARLAGSHGRIVGLLRPSDAFVLTRLARHAGHPVIERSWHAHTVEVAIELR